MVSIASESFIRLLAGSVILLGVCLGAFVDRWCQLIPALAALNLMQSTVTGICPPLMLLRAMGWIDNNDRIHWRGKHKEVMATQETVEHKKTTGTQETA